MSFVLDVIAWIFADVIVRGIAKLINKHKRRGI